MPLWDISGLPNPIGAPERTALLIVLNGAIDPMFDGSTPVFRLVFY
jgi:hypothetical protein